ncbi:MAG: hypothetical protein ACJAYE_002142 [Candidatus Azotimanducaceae bacterium]|jgi:hypothetical protein
MHYVPGDNSCRDSGSAQDKFAAVTETKALNALELFECCREKGLYPERVVSWHAAFISLVWQHQRSGTG